MKRTVVVALLTVVSLIIALIESFTYLSSTNSLSREPSVPLPHYRPIPWSEISVFQWNGALDSNVSLVTIAFPRNGTEVPTRNKVILKVDAEVPSWSYMGNLVFYADWLGYGSRLFYYKSTLSDYLPGYDNVYLSTGVTVTATFLGVPPGKHTLRVTANENTSLAGSSSVSFTVNS